MGEDWERTPVPRRRRRGVTVAGLAALVIIGGLLVRAGLPDRGPAADLQVEVADPMTEPGESTPGPVAAGDAAAHPGTGTWRALAPGPLGPRQRHSAVWTGTELVIWSGLGPLDGPLRSGAAYDPDADRWRVLAHSPLGHRVGNSATWTGAEMVIWGGVGFSIDAAAYDPAADAWRLLPGADDRAYHTAVLAGDELFIWGGQGGGTGSPPLADGFLLDPASGLRRPVAPGPLAGGGGYAAVWTGAEVIVAGRAADGTLEAAVYEPQADLWRPLPSGPSAGAEGEGLDAVDASGPHVGGSIAAFWTGSRLVVTGLLFGDHTPRLGAILDLGADAWTLLPDTGAGDVRRGAVTTLTPAELLVYGGVGLRGPVRDGGLALRLDDEAWRPLATSPLGPRLGATATWTGEDVLIWGGLGPDGALGDGAAFTPARPGERPPYAAVP